MYVNGGFGSFRQHTEIGPKDPMCRSISYMRSAPPVVGMMQDASQAFCGVPFSPLRKVER